VPATANSLSSPSSLSSLSSLATQDMAKTNMPKIPPKVKEISTDKISMEPATTTKSHKTMAMANKQTTKPMVMRQARKAARV
jgi:hypothetical protein